jgi:putative endonuclease
MTTSYYVYILTNHANTVLYTGITNNLERRLHEHRSPNNGFTGKYHATKLIYVTQLPTPEEAIIVEKKIKGWTRAKKIALINSVNPEWNDLLPLSS